MMQRPHIHGAKHRVINNKIGGQGDAAVDLYVAIAEL